MQFYYNSDRSSICDDVDFLCRSTSASYLLLDKLRNINQAYNDVVGLIWQSSDRWQYNDTNDDELPIAVADLVHGQQDYELDTAAQRVRRVEILDSAGNYLKLKPIDQGDVSIAMTEYNKTPGTPLYYDLLGRSIFLYPPPSSGYATMTSGLAVYVDRDVTQFTSASTAEPGFARPFHRLLSVRAALDFEQDPNQRNLLFEMRNRLEKGLARFYSHRGTEYTNKVYPKNKRNWRQYK